jgi:hypothetical protein
VATDLKRGEIFSSDRNKREQRSHQAIAVMDGVMHADRSAWFWFAFVHQLLAKVEQLEAGNDGPDWRVGGRCRAEPRFDGLQPTPIVFRHHHPSGAIERVDMAHDRSWGVGLSKMGEERSDAFEGKPFIRSDPQCSGLVDGQEPEEPSPRPQASILRGFRQACRLGEGIIVAKGSLPEQTVGGRPSVVG